MEKLNLVILGAGNLASHLSAAFFNANHRIIQIYSRTIDNAAELAKKFDSEAISELNDLNQDADLYVIALTDSVIPKIIKEFDFTGKNVVHTAGSISISVFEKTKANCGVFYPLQTFTKGKDIDFKNIPICLEANNLVFYQLLETLAREISNKVLDVNSENRQLIHLSGVFVNNFVNHLYSLSEELLLEKNLPFEILHELIKETVNKAILMGPDRSQTGPARRNNEEILKKHLDLLSSRPDFYQIYKCLTESIVLKYR